MRWLGGLPAVETRLLKQRAAKVFDHAILLIGAAVFAVPVLILFMASTQSGSAIADGNITFSFGDGFLSTYSRVLWEDGLFARDANGWDLLINSLVIATGFASLVTILSMLSAYALIYFRVPYADLIFAMILVSMFFPIESRFLPTFLVIQSVGLQNSYAGVILPLVATGFGTLVFRQFLRQVPVELFDAARLDGAGPWRFLRDMLIPMSAPMIVALFVILFAMGWNQYLWPLLAAPAGEDYFTIVRGIERAGRASNDGLALAILAVLPPVVLVIALQSYVVKGLTDAHQS